MESPLPKSPRANYSQASPSSRNDCSQPKKLTLSQVKNLSSTPYYNTYRFAAKAVLIEPKRTFFDQRVQYHRQRVAFADDKTFMTMFMYTDKEEEENDPKIVPNLTNIASNFCVIRKGEILIHDKTKAHVGSKLNVPHHIEQKAKSSYAEPLSPLINLEEHKNAFGTTLSAVVTVIKVENVHEVPSNYNKLSQCKTVTVIAEKTNFSLTLWDNAAIYTDIAEGQRIKLNDVTLTTTLTARFTDQIEVLPNLDIPIAITVEGFEAMKDNSVSIDSDINGAARTLNIQRENILELFNLDSASPNLYELADYLPVFAVVTLNGNTIETMETFENLQQAQDNVAAYSCPDMSDDEFLEESTTKKQETGKKTTTPTNDEETESKDMNSSQDIIEGLKHLNTENE